MKVDDRDDEFFCGHVEFEVHEGRLNRHTQRGVGYMYLWLVRKV